MPDRAIPSQRDGLHRDRGDVVASGVKILSFRLARFHKAAGPQSTTVNLTARRDSHPPPLDRHSRLYRTTHIQS